MLLFQWLHSWFWLQCLVIFIMNSLAFRWTIQIGQSRRWSIQSIDAICIDAWAHEHIASKCNDEMKFESMIKIEIIQNFQMQFFSFQNDRWNHIGNWKIGTHRRRQCWWTTTWFEKVYIRYHHYIDRAIKIIVTQLVDLLTIDSSVSKLTASCNNNKNSHEHFSM